MSKAETHKRVSEELVQGAKSSPDGKYANIPTMQYDNQYSFERGYPTAEAIRKAYDDADFIRATEAYKFFYPGVAFTAGFSAFETVGVFTNRSACVMQGSPKQVAFTANSDTPYAFVPLDLHIGPIVVEIPPAPLMCIVNDLNQQFVMDLGLRGPDAGKGGKHIVLPPDYNDNIPDGYYASRSSTFRFVLLVRVIPPNGDVSTALEIMKQVSIHPLDPAAEWKGIEWVDLATTSFDLTPIDLEKDIRFWKLLHRLLNEEPAYEPYRMNYGQLATLGIERGKPFAPDARLTEILNNAARTANDQMRIQSFADRRPERVVWPDRKWEWASLRHENGTFDMPNYRDLDARTKWFYQAMFESPTIFRRDEKAGSLYWLGLRDAEDKYLDGGRNYKLLIPLPVPANLFWSVTVYDNATRSEIVTNENKAALRSLFELKYLNGGMAELYFGPQAPKGKENRWIKTAPGKGWFVYFRIYGPNKPAFDGSWKPGDFQEIK